MPDVRVAPSAATRGRVTASQVPRASIAFNLVEIRCLWPIFLEADESTLRKFLRGDLVLIPGEFAAGFSNVGSKPDDAAVRRCSSFTSPYPHRLPIHSNLVPYFLMRPGFNPRPSQWIFSCGTMPLVGGFSWGSQFPPFFHSAAVPPLFSPCPVSPQCSRFLMYSSLRSSDIMPSRPFTTRTPRQPSPRNFPSSFVLFTDNPSYSSSLGYRIQPWPRNVCDFRVAPRVLVPRIFLHNLYTRRRLLQAGRRSACDASYITAVNHLFLHPGERRGSELVCQVGGEDRGRVDLSRAGSTQSVDTALALSWAESRVGERSSPVPYRTEYNGLSDNVEGHKKSTPPPNLGHQDLRFAFARHLRHLLVEMRRSINSVTCRWMIEKEVSVSVNPCLIINRRETNRVKDGPARKQYLRHRDMIPNGWTGCGEGESSKSMLSFHHHQGEQGSIPGQVTLGFFQVGIASDDAAGRWVFSGGLTYSQPLQSNITPFSPHSTVFGFQSLVRAVHIQQIHLPGASRRATIAATGSFSALKSEGAGGSDIATTDFRTVDASVAGESYPGDYCPPECLSGSTNEIVTSHKGKGRQGETTNFLKWCESRLLPNILSPSVTVLDNAPYHSARENKPPTMSSTLTAMRNRKSELLVKVRLHQQPPIYTVDKLFTSQGPTVIRLLPYYCDLNRIEYIWSMVKSRVANKNVCSVVVTPFESRRATSCGYNSSHPVWHVLYECLQNIHGDSLPLLLQSFHELSNGFWPRLTSPHPAIQFVPQIIYRVEVGALVGPVQSANIVVGVPLHSSP
ncbi:hypothetical protein PR048_009777 [Dryococelus australis]|uniref:Tc1-like transposase DDE domain-containing protein n=1 Tax=Dryococelus australis TaxID=614101 RepID=A0ABQ9I0X4_9NEOP|nr:hypothetical protein PR048_009777 [Dryococelus australis]